MDKKEILLAMLRILWDTYQELYPEENGFTFSVSRIETKDNYRIYKWSEMVKENYQPEEWYRFREEMQK